MVSFNPIIHIPKTFESRSIDFNNGIINTAKITATINSGKFRLFLTADGSNWEEVGNGSIHTFANPGTDLRWKIQGTGVIKKIIVSDYH